MRLDKGFANITLGLYALAPILEVEEAETAATLASMTTIFVAPPALVLGRFSTAKLVQPKVGRS